MKKNLNLHRSLLFVVATLLLLFMNNASFAQKSKQKQQDVIVTLNAYSFNDLLMAKQSRDKQPLYSLFNLMDWCANQNIKGIDLTGYYFPGYPEGVEGPKMMEDLKAQAERFETDVRFGMVTKVELSVSSKRCATG